MFRSDHTQSVYLDLSEDLDVEHSPFNIFLSLIFVKPTAPHSSDALPALAEVYYVQLPSLLVSFFVLTSCVRVKMYM